MNVHTSDIEPQISVDAKDDGTAPIRANYLSQGELENVGRQLADGSGAGHVVFAALRFPQRLDENERAINANHAAISEASRRKDLITPAAEWLLDHHHLIRENIRQVRRDLPLKFLQQLPKVKIATGADVPRVMTLVWTYVAHTDSNFDSKSLTALVDGFQESQTLTIGETWAIPAMLRFVLLENLRRLSDRVDVSRRMRDEANLFADRLNNSNVDHQHQTAVFDAHSHFVADDTFSAQLLYRLREDTEAATFALQWLENLLEQRGSNAEAVMISEYARISTGNLTVGNIIRSLRRIDDFDWTDWFEDVSKVDEVLRGGSDFARLDPATRNAYRTTVEQVARRSEKSELEIASKALELAAGSDESWPRNVGYYLIGRGVEELKTAAGYRPKAFEPFIRSYSRLGLASLLAPVCLLTALMMAVVILCLAHVPLETAVLVLLAIAFLPMAYELSMAIVRALVFALVKPSHLAGYELKSGIPDTARTLVVIPCLLSDRDTVAALVRNLEIHYLANPDDGIYFALLSDWVDSQQEQREGDQELLDFAEKEIERIAAKYAATGERRFFMLHRKRLYNESERVWMGWERKRGKLHELNQMLRGDQDTTFIQPKVSLPDNIQYVLTLDSDTRLPRDCARKLIGKLSHPLNAPVIDHVNGLVVAGYSVLQPRITPSLTTGDEASPFQRIFSKDRGLDPYVFAISDLYQDLYGEGSFTGKGIYHVDAFMTATSGRIDENAVLSHDLLEGSLARCALVTDITFIEDFPVRYEVELSRQHRWARGDWQLLPYLTGGTKALSALSRFKMLDNLRRSLMPVFWIAATVIGWLSLSPPAAAVWQLALIISYFGGAVVSLFLGVAPREPDVAPRRHFRTLAENALDMMAEIGLHVTFMANNALMMVDALVRTFYRLYVSRRHLLEWRTAQQAHASQLGGVKGYYRMMGASVAATIVVYLGVLAIDPTNWLIAGLISLVWLAAPAMAWWISRPLENEDRLEVSPLDAKELRVIARRTWHYFETFVTAEHNYMPPDNFQEVPEPFVANRTSPTNIGLYMLSTVTARDMGWISFTETLERIEKTIETVERMEKYKGHLYNWYDTKTLNTLWPRYISTVDSGNLAGHLIVVSSAFKEWGEAPAAYLLGDVQGIGDTLKIVRDALAKIADDRRSVRPLRRRLEERLEGFARSLDTNLTDPQNAPVRSIGLSVIASEVESFANDLDGEVKSASSRLLADWALRLKQACESHFSDAVFDRTQTQALRERLAALGERARALAFAMDFGFLFNRERRLLSIGFQADENRLDEACYDLLASEARLTSLFAIAKGDLPSEHWFRLGRPVTSVAGQASLVSWAGSMFEYLMPPIVMHERQGGILNQSDNLSIEGQIRYGKIMQVPWGISESAYNARDRELNYQYSNFGVPDFGLKRDIGSNLVIAPYATALASQFRPREAVRNLRRIESMGGLGAYGYYDAIDFTKARVPDGKAYAVVQNYMAHHQGMTITAIGNAVLNGLLRDRFHSDPVIEAAELLLQEKAPQDFVAVVKSQESEIRGGANRLASGMKYRVIDDPMTARRALSVLSNGHYSLMVTATGAGYSKWNGLSVTRWQPDPTMDDWGSHIFLRDAKSGEWWSATPGIRQAKDELAQAIFADEKAEFKKKVGSIESRLECIVATEADAEGRRLTIKNLGSSDRYIEVTSYAEVVMSPADSDAAHPVFSKMFVKTEIGETRDVIYASRNKRNHDEPDMALAHLMTGTSGRSAQFQAETDRRAFIGRGRDLAHARIFDTMTEPLAGHDGFTMDPIFSLRRIVRVPAGREASVVFWTIAAPGRSELEGAVERLRHHETFAHEARLAWTRSQVQIRHLDTSHEEALLFQRIAAFLIYPDPKMKQGHEGSDAPQSALWPMSISGDYPIFAIRIDNDIDLPIVNKSFRMQEYFRSHGVISDLVIINERGATYAQDVQHAIDFMCENARRRGLASGPGQHIFSIRRDLIDDAAYDALMGAARIVLHTRNGSLSEQIDRLERQADSDAADATVTERPKLALVASRAKPVAEDRVRTVAPPSVAQGDGLEFWNGYGGFSTDGREYVIRVPGGGTTPHPWINVISNGTFGFHVAAEGGGFTWSSNSRDYQLTPWSNDTVIDRPGEAFYIHDLDSKSVASPFAAFSPPDIMHEIRHSPGRSVFTAVADELDMEATQIVSASEPAKLCRLRIVNKGSATRRLRIYGYAEWVLGNNRAKTAPFIRTRFSPAAGAMLASNPYSIDNGQRTSFLAVNTQPSSYTAARGEFIGFAGDIKSPNAVAEGAALSSSDVSDGDPCAALAVDVTIEPGNTSEIVFILGDVDHADLAEPLIARIFGAGFDDELSKTTAEWDKFLGVLQVETPDAAFNNMVNTWLPYQNLACRIRARSAFYQASGAFGFRDQLQDTLALMLQDPTLARTQILNAASRQFAEGDVQHWWLPKTGAGVRTLISDDVAWLGYGTALYVQVTADRAILDEPIAYLKGEVLGEKHESFFMPETSDQTASLYEHCCKAFDLAIQRTGDNGLPLILCGDWNDGMNRVGIQGKGESTWLGWFLHHALKQLIPLARDRGDETHAAAWQAHCDKLKTSLEDNAWDGEWYRRGYFDDGSPLGSAQSDECRIDSIAQSWSVLSEAGSPERASQAMDHVLSQLVDRDAQIIRLFMPPFEHSDKDPGYIKSYPPGVRENGGQYTHAAIWTAYALAKMGRSDDAYSAFQMLMPVNHALTREAADRYRVEPYVVAADIYGTDVRLGRGGWTWYTGSAGWLYRTAVEAILGIRKEGNRIHVNPSIPAQWPEFHAKLRLAETIYEIRVENRQEGNAAIYVNGNEIEDNMFELTDR